MPSRYVILGLVLIVITAVASSAGFAYISPILFPAQKSPSPSYVIHFPIGSSNAPSDWNYTLGLLSPKFHWPWNFTVVVGVNNTIEWVNDDRIAHTVTALLVPAGATYFDSGFIDSGQSFVTTLSIPGVYKYDCAWHPWLAGVITVKPA